VRTATCWDELAAASATSIARWLSRPRRAAPASSQRCIHGALAVTTITAAYPGGVEAGTRRPNRKFVTCAGWNVGRIWWKDVWM
jgi:hypothetical protein